MIPAGKNDEELSEIVHKILKSIPADSELTLDLTHGLRPAPFLFFASCLYLQALKGVRIRKAWYGKLERDKPSPFVDLSVLLNMVEWFQAVSSFKDLTNPKALVDRMKEISTNLPKERNFKKFYSDFVDNIDDFACFFGAGLTLELGRASSAIDGMHSKMKEKYPLSEIPIPLAEDLMEEIVLAAEPFCLSR
jgi:CRISPR-associated DxTHG motif protein